MAYNDERKGSVEHIKSDQYRLRVTIGYLPNGNPERISKSIKAKNRLRAEIELEKWIIDLEESGFKRPDKTTFKSFFENQWLQSAQMNLEELGFITNRNTIEQRFLVPFTKKSLKEIKPFEIRDIIVNAKRLDGKSGELSRKTKTRMLSTLSGFFIIARDDYQLIEKNPCDKVKIPLEKGAKKKIQSPYSSKEISNLLTVLKNDELRTQVITLTALFTGARAGEMAALEEKHFDFKNKTVTFNQRIIAVSGEGLKRKDGLKGRGNNEKVLKVPNEYLELVQNLINENTTNRELINSQPEHNYLFGDLEGNPIRPTSLYQNWARVIKRYGLRRVRLHDLRHTSASYLISKNVPEKTVQERLGHSDYRTTMNMYVHGLEEVDEQAANEFGNMLNWEK